MSRYFDIRATVLIAVGNGLLPEEEDRPIAYDLKRAINERGRGTDGHAGVVVTDAWMLQTEMAAFFPVIAVGSPRVNAVTAQIYEELPVAYSRERRVFVQMDPEGSGKRVALWGRDREGTREASQVFVGDGHLDRFLDLVWRRGGP